MLAQDLAELLDSPVMMVVATRDAALRPALGRALGGRSHDGGAAADVFVSRAQWHGAVGNLVSGDPMALTFVHPEEYRAYQVKGPVTAVAPAGEDDFVRVADYIARITDVLTTLGVAPHQIERWLSVEDIVRITLRIDDVFEQTPGPQAGTRVVAAA